MDVLVAMHNLGLLKYMWKSEHTSVAGCQPKNFAPLGNFAGCVRSQRRKLLAQHTIEACQLGRWARTECRLFQRCRMPSRRRRWKLWANGLKRLGGWTPSSALDKTCKNILREQLIKCIIWRECRRKTCSLLAFLWRRIACDLFHWSEILLLCRVGCHARLEYDM